MQTDPTLSPTHPPLTGALGDTAVQNQILYYPKVVRSKSDEPVNNQSFGLFSMMLLQEPKQTKEGKRLLGFFKLRGNWSDEQQAEAKAARIVREQDSRHPIRVCHVGEWLPIVDDDALAKKTVNINLDDTDGEAEKHRREAERQNEEKKRQVMREMKEREEEIKNAKDRNEDVESLDHYTMKRVVWMRLRENIMQIQNQLDSLETKFEESREVLRKLDETHPDYEEQWIENYNKERRRAGIPDHVPSAKEEAEYETTRPRVDPRLNKISKLMKMVHSLNENPSRDLVESGSADGKDKEDE